MRYVFDSPLRRNVVRVLRRHHAATEDAIADVCEFVENYRPPKAANDTQALCHFAPEDVSPILDGCVVAYGMPREKFCSHCGYRRELHETRR